MEMLDVRRVYDGRTDSVWPEEVEPFAPGRTPNLLEQLAATVERAERAEGRAERQDQRLLKVQGELTDLKLRLKVLSGGQ